MQHVIGIDAGGTKTVCLLADEQGQILSRVRGEGANLQAAGELQVEKILHQVMDDALGGRPAARPRSASASPASIARTMPRSSAAS